MPAKKTTRTRATFHHPRKCKHLPRRSPKYPRWSQEAAPAPATDPHHHYGVIQAPLTTETAMKRIEEHNTLVLAVDPRAGRGYVKDAVRRLYGVRPVNVNLLVAPDGRKKAYVRLVPEDCALDLANKIGII